MEQLRQVAWSAVLWGLLADVMLTEVMSVVVGALAGIAPTTEPSMAEVLLRASPWFWPTFALGILFSGVGGYLAARLARREGAFHGTLTAFIGNIVLGLPAFFTVQMDTLRMAGVMLALLAGTAGGWLAEQIVKRDA